MVAFFVSVSALLLQALGYWQGAILSLHQADKIHIAVGDFGVRFGTRMVYTNHGVILRLENEGCLARSCHRGAKPLVIDAVEVETVHQGLAAVMAGADRYASRVEDSPHVVRVDQLAVREDVEGEGRAGPKGRPVEDLRRALERHELRNYYQPIISLESGAIVGFEALLRWQHPERGMILPDLFIQVAEDTGLIHEIGRFVLDLACRQGRAWQEAHPMSPQLRLSVNLSARQIQHPGMVALVADALATSHLPADSLILEITESALMDDPRSSQSMLAKLRDLGISTSIDDYGTGYSSLAYIKQLAVNEIKIDRAFVSGMEADRRNAAIVRSTIELGHNLGLTVVAEGVEDDTALARLAAMGCEHAQGFGIGKPMPQEQFLSWLAQRRSGGRASVVALPLGGNEAVGRS